MIKLIPFMVIMASLSSSAIAVASQNQTSKPTSETTTRMWLKLQSSNSQATRYNDKLSPAAAKAAQKRMEKSFNNEIPEKFIKDKFGE